MNKNTKKTILYHGRFQPPHRGHVELIKHFLKKYKNSTLIISMDIRKKDRLNPFSFNFRKQVFLKHLGNYKNRVIITKHQCENISFIGCLKPTYESSKKHGDINLVIGGPELPKEAKAFWNSKGVEVETVSHRFYDISSTEIRNVLLSKNNGFSIITAFGCRYNHGYCVWKRFHKLRNTTTTYENTNWIKLEELISWYPNEKINVSGGLDPLYNFDANRRWWDKIFQLAEKYNKLVDVHTREFVFDKKFIKQINKIVFSFDNLEEIRHQILKFPQKVKIRITKIIHQETSLGEVKEIVEFAKKNNFEVTFKELYGFDDKGNFEKLNDGLSKFYNLEKNKVVFLKHKDYNLYFMPDSKVYDKFLI